MRSLQNMNLSNEYEPTQKSYIRSSKFLFGYANVCILYGKQFFYQSTKNREPIEFSNVTAISNYFQGPKYSGVGFLSTFVKPFTSTKNSESSL